MVLNYFSTYIRLRHVMTWPENVGILALEVYIPNTYVSHEELETYDGVSKGRIALILVDPPPIDLH